MSLKLRASTIIPFPHPAQELQPSTGKHLCWTPTRNALLARSQIKQEEWINKVPTFSLFSSLSCSFYDPLEDVKWRRIERMQVEKVKIRDITQRKALDQWHMEQSLGRDSANTRHLILFQKAHRSQPHPPTPHTELLITLDISASDLLAQI